MESTIVKNLHQYKVSYYFESAIKNKFSNEIVIRFSNNVLIYYIVDRRSWTGL